MNLLTDYDFDLPTGLIATRAQSSRSASRLLVLKRESISPTHDQFINLHRYLRAGDVLVVNNTKVMKARIYAYKPTGGKVELLVIRVLDKGRYLALVKGKVHDQAMLALGAPDGSDFITIIGRDTDEPDAFHIYSTTDLYAYMANHGELPLPPYMERKADSEDEMRYQTVFSGDSTLGAVAAPTAGLHFDHDTIADLKARGIRIANLTLHVGPGTFLPVRTDNLDDHKMHQEHYILGEESAALLYAAKKEGRRIIAVGTTSMRVLEHVMHTQGQFIPSEGATSIFIRPGHRFLGCQALVTNFHLPKSTLFILVSAVAGRERMLNAYREAIRNNYRFYSYGDACFLEISEHE